MTRISNVGGGSSSGGVTSIAKQGSTALTGAVTLSEGSNITLTQVGQNIAIASTAGGAGTVTSVSVVSANGISGTVANATTTPAITMSLGAITPTSVNGLTLHSDADGFDITGGTTPRKITMTGGDITLTGSGANVVTFPNRSLTIDNLTTATTTNLTGFIKGNGSILSADNSTYLTSVTPHNILSTTHGDTLADTVVRGDILYGNVTPKWARLAFPATPTGKVIQATATDVAWSTNPLTIGTSASVSNVNTGDQTITLTGDVTGSGTGSFAATIKSSVGLAGSPTTTTQASTDNSTKIATTAYVTTGISNAIAGVNPAVAVQMATTVAGDTSGLTYNNGVSGVGATFTGSVNTALTFDGQTITAVGQRVLVKNDTQAPSGAFNGVYSLTQLQTAILPPILTRATDYNQPSDINNTGAIPVVLGTANAQTTWVITSTVTTVGTDPLTFTQFSLKPSTIVTLTGTQALTNKTITDASNTVNANTLLSYPANATPTANNIPVLDAQGALPYKDGWTPITDSWSYATASTITVPSGAASLYQKGDRIKFTQTTVKYFVITAVADTVLTVAVNTDYVVANAAISAIFYSHQANPLGYPHTFNFTPAWGELTVGNGTNTGILSIEGNVVSLATKLTWGSTTSIAGNPHYDPGIAPAIFNRELGVAYYEQVGTARFVGFCTPASAASFYPLTNAGAILTSTVPFTWANTHILSTQISYQF